MIIAATPIDPPEGELCWTFWVVNDSDAVIREVRLEAVHYEWGDNVTTERPTARAGPIGAGGFWELWRDTASELRTSLQLVVDGKPVMAEFGRLYRVVPRQVEIPLLKRKGLIAELS